MKERQFFYYKKYYKSRLQKNMLLRQKLLNEIFELHPHLKREVPDQRETSSAVDDDDYNKNFMNFNAVLDIGLKDD